MIAQSVATGWITEVRFPAGTRNEFFLHSAQTGSGTYPDSYLMGTGSSFLRGKDALA
jgi:hypothetical protein